MIISVRDNRGEKGPPLLFYGLVITAIVTIGAIFSMIFPVISILNAVNQTKSDELNMTLAFISIGLLLLAFLLFLIGIVTVIMYSILLTIMSKGVRGFVFFWTLLLTLASAQNILRSFGLIGGNVDLVIFLPYSIFLFASSIVMMTLMVHPTIRRYFNSKVRNRVASQCPRTEGRVSDVFGPTGSVDDLIEQSNWERR